MEMTIQIESLNYGDAAVRLMPLLEQAMQQRGGAAAMTVEALAGLPADLIHTVFDAIDEQKKRGIMAAFAAENKEALLRLLNSALREQQFGVELSDLTMDQDLKITAQVCRVDFLCLVQRFLPVIRQRLMAMCTGLLAMLRPVVERASAEQILDLLERFLGTERDVYLVSMVDQNSSMLAEILEKWALDQGIRMKIRSVSMGL